MGSLHRCLPPCSSSACSRVLLTSSIDPELWLMAEKRAEEILWILQPSLASVQKRQEVIEYIQKWVKHRYGTLVFPYGSVPLKTYLPDGDLDVTILSLQNIGDDLAIEVCNILQHEEQKAESEVKDVQYIQAQVKIVKCSVKNISVDISFNQMAGLCSLCFLEEVDQLIGKDHLFKKSIILIKAWCYYESRILGAYYNLLSTYALEILVLYIINAFHSSLSGPLAVLHRFLEYYSTFDWDNYCVTISGLVAVSSLPEIIEPLNGDANELLLSPEVLKRCKEKLLNPMDAVENGGRQFSVKHMNIVDPLKDNNNLGRSVSKGNLCRIKSALTYGLQNLEKILKKPKINVGAGLEGFFVNSLDRVRMGERPDSSIPVPAFGTGRSDSAGLTGDCINNYSGLLLVQLYHNYSIPVSPRIIPPPRMSQLQQRYTRDAPSELPPCQQHVLFYTGTYGFISRMSPCYPYEMCKSRGTGSFIPYVKQQNNKRNIDMLVWRRVNNPDSIYPVDSPQLPARSKKSVILEINQRGEEARENGSSNDLLLGQCATLPCSEKSEIFELDQSVSEKEEYGFCMNPSLDPFHHSPCSRKLITSEFNQCEAEKRENGSLYDLSLDHFPPLPSAKKTINQSRHHVVCFIND